MSLTHAPQVATPAVNEGAPSAAPAAPAHTIPVAGLMVGSADDRAESDADALADKALRRLHAGAAVAPSVGGGGTPSDDVHAHGPSCGHLRRSAAPSQSGVVGAAGGALDAATSGQISGRTGGGRGLPDGVRRSMEGAFGTGLGHVRIHDDSTSASLNKAVSARAFTTGSDIFFGAGEYAPHDPVGQKVLAHELAHVVTEGGSAPLRRMSLWTRAFGSDAEKQTARDNDAAEEVAKAQLKQAKEDDKRALADEKKRREDEAAKVKLARKSGQSGRAEVSGKINNGTVDPNRFDGINPAGVILHPGDPAPAAVGPAAPAVLPAPSLPIPAAPTTPLRTGSVPAAAAPAPRLPIPAAPTTPLRSPSAAPNGRLASVATVAIDPATKHPIADPTQVQVGMEYNVYLNRLFAATLEAEQAKLKLEMDGLSPADADDPVHQRRLQLEAFDWAWGPSSPNAVLLKPLVPRRASGADMLTADVRHAREHANVAVAGDKATAKRTGYGKLLPEDVELVYDRYVAEIKAQRTSNPQMAVDEVYASASATVWGAESAEIQQKRPQEGSALDSRAILDAQKRALAADPGAAVGAPGAVAAAVGAPTPGAPAPAPAPTPAVAAAAAASAAKWERIEGAEGVMDTTDGVVGDVATAIGYGNALLGEKGRRADKLLDNDNDGTPLWASDPLGIGGAIHESREAQNNVATGNLSAEPDDYEQSTYTKANEGIESVVGLFASVTSSVAGVLKFVTAMKSAQGSTDPRAALKAGKAGTDALGSLTETAKATAKFAVFIDDKLDKSVRKVIPGLNIVTAVLSVASNAMELALKSERMDETNKALLAARRDSSYGSEINELVYPLLRVSQRHAQNLEKTAWSTGISITEVITSIATVASGGGFGIPTAIQTGIGALDTLHSLGHFIADEYMTFLSKEAAESSVGALEGSSEQLLRNNPGVAVDGIILRAARKDAVAVAFLKNYRVGGEPVDEAMLAHVALRPIAPPAALAAGPTAASGALAAAATAASGADKQKHDMLFKIRESVLEEMGESADPEYTFNTWKAKAAALVTAVGDRWRATGDLAEKRNAIGAANATAQLPANGAARAPGAGAGLPQNVKTGRGFWWRFGQMFTRKSKFDRLVNQTAVESMGELVVTVGTIELTGRVPADVDTFLAELDALEVSEIKAAVASQTSDEAREILLDYLVARAENDLTQAAAAAAAAPAVPGVPQPSPAQPATPGATP